MSIFQYITEKLVNHSPDEQKLDMYEIGKYLSQCARKGSASDCIDYVLSELKMKSTKPVTLNDIIPTSDIFRYDINITRELIRRGYEFPKDFAIDMTTYGERKLTGDDYKKIKLILTSGDVEGGGKFDISDTLIDDALTMCRPVDIIKILVDILGATIPADALDKIYPKRCIRPNHAGIIRYLLKKGIKFKSDDSQERQAFDILYYYHERKNRKYLDYMRDKSGMSKDMFMKYITQFDESNLEYGFLTDWTYMDKSYYDNNNSQDSQDSQDSQE